MKSLIVIENSIEGRLYTILYYIEDNILPEHKKKLANFNFEPDLWDIQVLSLTQNQFIFT